MWCPKPLRVPRASAPPVIEPLDLSVKAYPNPSLREVSIEFYLDESKYIEIDVFDLNGKWIWKVTKRDYPRGYNRVSWRDETINPGTYICRISSGSKVKTTKFVIINVIIK